MKLKNIAALALTSAMILSAAPAMAATGTVTVKWNTQKSAAIVLHTQTTASLTHTTPAATDMYQGFSGATLTGNCNNTATPGVAGAAGFDGGNGGVANNGVNVDGTVNFGQVTPDGVNYVNCLEVNAVEADITTNDGAGVSVTAALTGTPVGYDAAANGSLICLFGDGFAMGATPAGATAWTVSARAAAVAAASTTACPAGGLIMTGAASTPIVNSSALGNQDLNQDMELILGPNSTVGSVTATLTYTVTPN